MCWVVWVPIDIFELWIEQLVLLLDLAVTVPEISIARINYKYNKNNLLINLR
jgi:hypothetical protein